MSRAEAEMSALATQFHFNVTTDFGQAEQSAPGPDRQEPGQGPGGRRHVRRGRRGDPARSIAVEKAMADDALREFEVSQGLATPETTKVSQSTKELGPAAKTLAPLPEI